MDTDFKQKRLGAFRDASETIQHLYSDSEGTGKVLREVIITYNITEDTARKFINAVGDCMLGFFPKGELAGKITEYTGIPQDTAEKIAGELRELLKPVPSEPILPKADPTLRERLHLRPEGARQQQNNEEIPNNNAAMKLFTKDELADSLSSKHTMVEDVAAIQNKDTKETKKDVLANTPVPKYSKPFIEPPENKGGTLHE